MNYPYVKKSGGRSRRFFIAREKIAGQQIKRKTQYF